jgi:hypothetical protein
VEGDEAADNSVPFKHRGNGMGEKKPSKGMVFMLNDFEEIHPQVILFLKVPVEATMFMGRKEEVSKVALRVDDPEKLKRLLEQKESA